MNLKVKYYLGEILLLLFSMLSSFLFISSDSKMIWLKPILDLDIYRVGMYILIIILPVIFSGMLKNSIRYSLLSFWIYNILAMLLYVILYKTEFVSNVIKENFYFSIVIYIIILSVIQSSIFILFQKFK